MAERTCADDGCTHGVVARGWCNTHYKRWYRANRDEVSAAREARARERCSYGGCEKPWTRRGWCSYHYSRWRTTGDPAPPMPPAPRPELCTVEGCGKPNKQGGLCSMHDFRMRARGEVGSPEPEKVRELIHGTVTGYKHRKCRCAECREAKRLNDLDWRARHRVSYRESRAAYQRRNAERVTEYRRRWKRANPDKITNYSPDRAAAPFDHAALDYCTIIAGDPCVFCGGSSEEIDHIVPVSICRSSHWMNLAPACAPCNGSKGAKSLLDFMLYRLPTAVPA